MRLVAIVALALLATAGAQRYTPGEVRTAIAAELGASIVTCPLYAEGGEPPYCYRLEGSAAMHQARLEGIVATYGTFDWGTPWVESKTELGYVYLLRLLLITPLLGGETQEFSIGILMLPTYGVHPLFEYTFLFVDFMD